MLPIIVGLWALPMVRKVVLYGGAAALLLFGGWYALHRYGNRREQEGRNAERVQAVVEAEKEVKAKYATAVKALQDKDRNLTARESIADAQIEASSRMIAELQKNLDRRLSASAEDRRKRDAEIDAIPDLQLDDDLRDQLARTNAAEASLGPAPCPVQPDHR